MSMASMLPEHHNPTKTAEVVTKLVIESSIGDTKKSTLLLEIPAL